MRKPHWSGFPAFIGAAVVARYTRAPLAWAMLTIQAALTVLVEVLADEANRGMMVVLLGGQLLVAAPAVWIRRGRHRARQRQQALVVAEQRAAAAAEEERQRIAAELHDVVAHGLTIISMQAAMLPTMTVEEERRGTERVIEQAARQSLIDLRRMLTVLRGSPQNMDTQNVNGVGHLGQRLDEFEDRLTDAGFEVERKTEGLESLSGSLEMTVLRVFQEAVTNVLKHATRGIVRLTSRRDDEGSLIVEIISPLTAEGSGGDGIGHRVCEVIESGFGLAGMKERVDLFGGSLVAEPTGECWSVRATLSTR